MKFKINLSIFHAYDIRGIYLGQINEEIAYLIGRAFVKFLRKPKLKIVIGMDNRLSSDSLAKHLKKGITDQGADIIDIGLSVTPMFYWTVARYKFDGGIEISASHNPPRYNGFKLVRENAIPIGEQTGLLEIKKIVQNQSRIKEMPKCLKGGTAKKKVLREYLKFNLQGVKKEIFRDQKIIIDSGNGVPAILVSEIFKTLPLKGFHLFPKLNGNFPNRPLDPLKKGALKTLQKKVLEKKADLGAAFDGDGDRIIFVDENGKIIPSDLITALLSEIILEKTPSQKILYNVCSSRRIAEIVREKGGIPIMGRVGHSFIKKKMREENIVFAGEFSGHFYFKEHYFTEAPLFILFKILKRMSETKKTISALLKPYKKYFHSGEINFRVKDKKEILKFIESKYKKGKVLKLDGLRIDFKNWWFNVRPSQTEPVLRLVVEAETKKLMEEKKKEISSLIY
jgi:phosphomannomutase